MLNKKLIIVDFDEVLMNISYKWVKLAYENKIIKDKYSEEEVNNRREYYLQDWLGITGDQRDEFQKIYNENLDTFYYDLKPNKIVKSLQVGLNNNSFNLVCISHIPANSNNDSKIETFEYLFNKKGTIHLLNYPEKKSECIKNNNYDFSLFIDDKLANILDVISSFHDKKAEYNIPSFGYNDFEKFKFENLESKMITDFVKLSNSEIKFYENSY